ALCHGLAGGVRGAPHALSDAARVGARGLDAAVRMEHRPCGVRGAVQEFAGEALLAGRVIDEDRTEEAFLVAQLGEPLAARVGERPGALRQRLEELALRRRLVRGGPGRRERALGEAGAHGQLKDDVAFRGLLFPEALAAVVSVLARQRVAVRERPAGDALG